MKLGWTRENRFLLVRGGLWLAVSAGLGVFPFSVNAVDAPTTRPAASNDPTTNRIRRALDDLTDKNPTIREQARHRLMTLSRNDLPALRAIVKENAPLSPAQVDGLQDIVTQVYLSDTSYPSDLTQGFLGVMFDLEQEAIELECGGVEIRRRIPGFCAFRELQDGDIVLSIGNPPAVLTFRTSPQMTQAVKLCPAGRTIPFNILRRGRLIHLPITLDARPSNIDGQITSVDFVAQRNAEAAGYWEENFEPLVELPATP